MIAKTRFLINMGVVSSILREFSMPGKMLFCVRVLGLFVGVFVLPLVALVLPVEQVSGRNTANTGTPAVEGTNIPTPTPFYTNGGPFPDWPLACPWKMVAGEGPTWRGVTIGKSSMADLEELYGVRFAQLPPRYAGNFAPTFYINLVSKTAEQRKMSQVAQACPDVNGKIAVLELSLAYDENFPSGWLHDWVWQYGVPEITTWIGNEWDFRIALWPKQGFALAVDVQSTDLDPKVAAVNSIYYYPFVTDDQYMSRWPFSGLRKEAPTVSNNMGFPTKENPIDYEAMMAAKPKEFLTGTPSSTPAPNYSRCR